MIERTGIVEEGIRRRAVFKRYIDRKVTYSVEHLEIDAIVKKAVAEKAKAEIDRLIARRMTQFHEELGQILPPPKFTLADLMGAVTEVTGIGTADLLGPRRTRRLAWPRHFLYWLTREVRRDLSLPAIGIAYKRDHTSIMHGIRQAARLREEEPFKGWFEAPRIREILVEEAAK